MSQTGIRPRKKQNPGIGLEPWIAGWVVAVLLAVLLGVPFVATLYKSFLGLDPAFPADYGTFIGLRNYITLLTSEPEFWSSFRASAIFVALATAQCFAALGFAVWLRRLWPARLPKILVIALVTPLLVSPTCLGLMGRFYFHDQIGIISKGLRTIGWLSENAAPLASSRGAWIVLAILDSWQWLPFTALLFWLSFHLVPERQIEAAKLDGLSRFTLIRSVYAPCLLTPTAVVFLMRQLEAFRAFELPQVMTGGGPGTSTLMSSLYANRVTFVQQRFGMGAGHLILLEAAAMALIYLLVARMQAFRRLLRERSI